MHALRTFEKNGRAVASFRYPGADLDLHSHFQEPIPGTKQGMLGYRILIIHSPNAKNEAVMSLYISPCLQVREFIQESGLCIWFARAAIRKYHRLEGLYNRNLFRTVLEGRSQNQGVSKDGSF